MTTQVFALSGAGIILKTCPDLAVCSKSKQASRYLGKNTPYGKKGGKMRILEQLKVGNDQYIILLKLDEKQYLLGTSQTGIQVLERFKEEKTNE